eukprot:TRINITY_DN8007_c0_g1_i5.p1 TRINITY_DN8007_c0_g1~~TRINITY_DN8007_c0_g1_i5.p1  ORF type:complete len:547 (+),score=76.86 TRINITY_DN8007_c0_g1_i5:42-1682(+)
MAQMTSERTRLLPPPPDVEFINSPPKDSENEPKLAELSLTTNATQATPLAGGKSRRKRKLPSTNAIFDRLAEQDRHDDLETLLRCGPGSILQGMKSHANSVSVHRLGTKALLTMAAKDEQQCLSLGGDVALTTLVIALRQHTSEQDVVANVLSCLSLITAASSDAPEILIGKDLAVLLARVMSDHLSNDDIQEQACWLIEAFGKHEGSDYLSLLAPQIVPQLLQSARHHASNTTVLESALQAAAPMLSDNSEYASHMTSAECTSWMSLLLALLERYAFVASIAEPCCILMCVIASSRDKALTAFEETRMQSGDTPLAVLFKIYHIHGSQAHVMEHWAYLLYLVVFQCTALRDESIECHGPQAVAQLIRQAQTFQHKTTHACCLYLHTIMSGSDARKDSAVQAEAIPAIMKCLENMQDSDEIVAAALLALLSLSVKPRHRLALIQHPNSIKLVMHSIQLHQEQPMIQEYGTWILDNLSLDQQHHEVLLQNGGLEFLQTLIDYHRANPSGNSTELSARALGILRQFQQGGTARSTDMCSDSLPSCVLS